MLTGFQFRAALVIGKITAKELSQNIDLHEVSLLRLKKNTSNLEYLNCFARNMLLLQRFFEDRGIIFPDKNIIALNTAQRLNDVSRFHLVTARVAAGLTQNQLSQILRVSYGTISLLEKLDNLDPIRSVKLCNSTIVKFFEAVGIIFKEDYSVILKRDPKEFMKKTKMFVDTK